MNKKIILYWTIGTIIIGSFFLLNSVLTYETYETFAYPEYAAAATSTQVTVSAEITAGISCSTDAGSTDFGTWTDTSVKTSSPAASTTMSCANSANGCTLYAKDEGSGSNPGLWNSTSSYLIASASTTLSTGNEGYGIQATSTATGGGAALTFNSVYNKSGNAVGGLLRTNVTVAYTNSTSSSREAVTTRKAAISGDTPSGTYDDTITYECTANP